MGRESWETKTSFIQINDGRANLVANETNSWKRDHSYDTGNVTEDGKY